jgi:multiple sugar transport system substrate-binding protein
MKHKLRKITAVLTLLAMLLMVACGNDGNDNSNSGDVVGGETTGGNGDETTPIDGVEHQGVIDRAAELANSDIFDEVFDDGFAVTERIRHLSWFATDENSPTMETFKARFGVPVEGESPIERIATAYETRYERLNQLISSGDSPDMFQFEERYFPWGAHAEQFLPVDDIIDFDRPEWDDTREIMELFNWGGRNYTAITELTNSTALLFYRNSVAQGAGLRDPYEVWRAGEWTWDVMLDMVTSFSVRDEKWGITGFYNDESAILSTGVGIISIEDGILVNNMSDRRIERAMDMLLNLAQNDFRYPYHELNDFQMNPTEFRHGNILFWNDGPWRYSETFTNHRRADTWDDDELRIVPFPRDPEAPNERHFIRGKQDAMMWVKGSTNQEGFLAWTYSALVAQQDDVMRVETRERDIESFAWTNAQLDILEELRCPERFGLVWDFKNGIGLDIADAVTESPVQLLTRPVIVDGEPYAGQRDANRGVIIPRIELMNENVSQ